MPPVPQLSLETAATTLGWPDPARITTPPGPAASLFAEHVRDKLEQPLRCGPSAADLRCGVLMENPDAATSEPPLAIVVESEVGIQPDVLREIHRLAWNFSHAPTVITVEPTLLRVWTCCEPPDPARSIDEYLVEGFSADHLRESPASGVSAPDSGNLHWVSLVSGIFFEKHAVRFGRHGRADRLLMANLQFLRSELSRMGLADDVCHDLIARVIFVQFLSDRKDAQGRAALNGDMLQRLHTEGVLAAPHASFAEVLRDHRDTYRFFDWLNGKFNGDLFSAHLDAQAPLSDDGSREIDVVTVDHLALLADFIRGDIEMPDNQYCLWPQYAFDVIPLEFISSIYETFVGDAASSDGVYYTPPYLVDALLDQVLPWDSVRWDIRILDPACGSGVFLVKAFRRLVHRWKNAHPRESLRVPVLRRLLERNLFGVDKDPHAVRVASFSLYLAMCDEIDPKHYWTQVKFPSMRHQRLVCSDFFADDVQGFDTVRDARTYDLVVGNAPFGARVITDPARRWARDADPRWTIPNQGIGGLFLAKAALLTSEDGTVAMIQSANTILFNIGRAAEFRKQLFSRYAVDAIFNLSALRRSVFKGSRARASAVAPVCIVIMRSTPPPADHEMLVVSPKFLRPLGDDFTIVVEPDDRWTLAVDRAINDPSVWTELMWARPRDMTLIRRLRTHPTLATMEAEGRAASRVGIIFGDRARVADCYDGFRFFDAQSFPVGDPLYLDADALPVIDKIAVHSRDSTNADAFDGPQLILKRSWTKRHGRFEARIPRSRQRAGVLCTQSYVSVRADRQTLAAAAATYNSKLAVYLYFLTSGRFAAYRPQLAASDVLAVPLPEILPKLPAISSVEQLDETVFDLFELKDAERVLIDDAIAYTLGDFLDGDDSLGRQPTAANPAEHESERHLRDYCEYFVRVLKAGFGNDRHVTPTIYRTGSDDAPGRKPYRLVRFALGGSSNENAIFRELARPTLLDLLRRVWIAGQDDRGIVHQRVARIYEISDGLPTILVMKPDQKRFWTRSMGLEDGDSAALDLFLSQREPNGQGATVH